jgi:hypothetical protein
MKRFDLNQKNERVKKLNKFLNKHLEEADENYFQHFKFTAIMSFQIFLTALILLIHGFLPFLFTRTTSKRLKRIDEIFQERVRKIEERLSIKGSNI